MDYLLSNPALFPVLSYVCVPVLCLIDWIELSKISLSLYLIPQNCCAMLSCSVVSNSLWPPGSSVHGDSPGKNTGVGCHALLQGIFLTRVSNPGLPRCRQIHCLSRQRWLNIHICSRSWVFHSVPLKLQFCSTLIRINGQRSYRL